MRSPRWWIRERTGGASRADRQDFSRDQEVRWCPVRGLRDPERRPGLHARARPRARRSCSSPESAAPLASRTTADLRHALDPRPRARDRDGPRRRGRISVWVVTGDGDALSIGGNHLIHALRRNVNLKILVFNNRIYGLTKGQYSPTSELGKVTKSTPMGSLDHPFNPLSVAIGAEASFVGRAIDTDKKGLTEVLGAAARHRGSAFVEILQNCNIYNDGASTTCARTKATASTSSTARPSASVSRREGRRQDADGSARVVDVADVEESSCSSTTRATGSRALRSRSPGSRSTPTARCRSASSATSSARCTTISWRRSSRATRALGGGRSGSAPPLGRHLDRRPRLTGEPVAASGRRAAEVELGRRAGRRAAPGPSRRARPDRRRAPRRRARCARPARAFCSTSNTVRPSSLSSLDRLEDAWRA